MSYFWDLNEQTDGQTNKSNSWNASASTCVQLYEVKKHWNQKDTSDSCVLCTKFLIVNF